MTTRRRLALCAGATIVAGLLGYALNLGYPESVSRAWPGRAMTIPVAVFFGPWWGGVASAAGALPALRQQPGPFFLFAFEGILLGVASTRLQSPLAARGLLAAFLAASVALFPRIHGLPDLSWWTAPVAFQRLLVLLVAPAISDLFVAALSMLGFSGTAPAVPRQLRSLIFHAFVLAATLPILVVSTVSGEFFAARQKEEVYARLNDTALSLADRVNSYVDLHLSGVATLAASVEAATTPEAREMLLQRQARIYPDFRALAIADAGGLVQQIRPGSLMRPGLSIADQKFFADALKGRQVTISDVSASPATGDPLVFLGAPIVGADGRAGGVAHGSLKLDAFEYFVESYITLADSTVIILDRNHRVIFSSMRLGLAAGDDMAGSAMVRLGAGAPMDEPFTYDPERGDRRATQLAARAVVPTTGWTVYVQQPQGLLLTNVPTYFLVTFGLVLVALIGSAIGARYFASTVTAPLENLVGFVRNLSLGTAEAAPLSAHAPAEIAALTDDVNGMQQRLRESYSRLEEALADGDAANRSLEHLTGALEGKVEQRTSELTTTTQFLENILAALPGALFVSDSDGTIQLCNDSASTLAGRPVSELTGSPLSAVFEAGAVHQSVESPVVRSERTLLTVTGERVPVFVSSALLDSPGADGRAGAIHIAIDIRDRKQLEIELHQAQKLESVGRLAAGVAHEINTPTQFVSDSVQFLKDGLTDLFGLVAKYRALHHAVVSGAPTSELAADVVRAERDADLEYLIENVPGAIDRSIDGLGRVTTIVKSMKDFAHPDRKEMVEVDLNLGIQSTLIIARNEYKYVADVETNYGQLSHVRCHGGDINQVVLNIVVNAAHAITDVVAGSSNRGRIVIETRQDGDYAVIRIADTGGGIPEAIRDRVFDPFFTTKGVGKGTGQGLAIARSLIIDKHQGQFTFETETGHGTTFTIRLPIAGPRRAGAAAA